MLKGWRYVSLSCSFLAMVGTTAAGPPKFAGGCQPGSPDAPEVSVVPGSESTLRITRHGKQYVIDLVAKTVRESASALDVDGPHAEAAQQPQGTSGPALFSRNCSACHGADGKGIRAIGTPNFSDPSFQASISDQGIRETIRNGKAGRMPAWGGKLSDQEIGDLNAYIRSLAAPGSSAQARAEPQRRATVYHAGDDLLLSLPTGRPTDRHGVYVNFTHRFAYDPAFRGQARGAFFLGLDGYALPSFGFRYGITDKFSASVFRSPSVIGRPIQLAAAYSLLDEQHGAPFNLTVRASIEGQDNFRKNFTENIEGIASKSITRHAQMYFVPTMSFNARPLTQGGLFIPGVPGFNAFSLGVGVAVDIRPTVALLAEVIPTLWNGPELGIHRPPYGFGIQKKIYRHAFTFGFTTGPGVTISQRSGSRAQFLGNPSADIPSGLFVGFDLTRQIR